MWPPVQVGHVYHVCALDNCYHMITLCTRPAIFAIPKFLTSKECIHLVKSARSRLEAALVSGPNGKEVDAALRNNKQAMLSTKHSPITRLLTSRVLATVCPLLQEVCDDKSAEVAGDGFSEKCERDQKNEPRCQTQTPVVASSTADGCGQTKDVAESCGGYLTVLQYKEREHFMYHYDSGGIHRRMATMLYYLTDVSILPSTILWPILHCDK